jgi:cobalt transporter subunit CbtA
VSLTAALKRIVVVAALSGLISGIVMTAAQWVRVVPLILEAETYEVAGDTAGAASEHVGHADHVGMAAWSPAAGWQRTASTFLANLLAAVGFALLLTAGLYLSGHTGWRQGLWWGLAGFLTFTLAPALGLPPEPPGIEAAPLAARQAWWLGTVVATGGGLALMVLLRRPWSIALGAASIALPHLIGAPRPELAGGVAPEQLAGDFAVAVVVTGLVFWLVLGATTGALYRRLSA